MNDSSIYQNINSATASLQLASAKAEQLISSLTNFSNGLNKKGSLANEFTTDTLLFQSVRTTILKLSQIADSASLIVSNLKRASENKHSPIGVLLHNEESGNSLKETIRNLEKGSKKLDEDLEAAQHNILLRGFFKKKTKEAENVLPEK